MSVCVKAAVFAVALMANVPAAAAAAQQENPLFSEAHQLWQQISASALNPDTKAAYGQRFGDLASEQRQLWDEAGLVDAGQCTGGCLEDYDNQVSDWQSRLQAFNDDARALLDTLRPRPGRWEPFGPAVAYGNMSCSQVYRCTPAGEEMMIGPDTRVVTTPATTRYGTCYTTVNGDPRECGQCAVNPPTDPCLWHTE